jgi:hypothetical protein
MSEPIYVESNDSHFAMTFVVFGIVMAALNFVIHFFVFSQMYIANMFLYGFSIALILLGYLKKDEPQCRIKITDEGLTYYHRANSVFIEWQNISRMDIPTESRLEGGQSYEFIGIKVKDVEHFYDRFPLRLASRLLIEQRPLWLALAGKSCSSGQCVPEDFIDSIECKLSSNRIYNGLIAMFVHRAETLNRLLGFHFYISTKSLTLSPSKVLNLLQDTKNTQLNTKFDPTP